MLLTENEYNLENTTDFADRLNNYTLEDDEIITSYDVSSLFIDEPLDISFDYIIEEIYTKNKLSKLCSKLLFRRLLVLSPFTEVPLDFTFDYIIEEIY